MKNEQEIALEIKENSPPDYEKIIEEGIIENLKQLKEIILDLDEKDLLENKHNAIIEKIIIWAKKYGFLPIQVLKKAKEDPLFACIFIKEPSRQNLAEIAAAKYIEKLSLVKNFKKLPPGGKACVHLERGVFNKGEILSPLTKSIDFRWETEKYIYYTMHKYTKDEGGAQDNQCRDIQNFLESCKEFREKEQIKTSRLIEDISLNKKIYFLAICDGKYYQKIQNKTKTRMEKLNALYIENSKAISIDKLAPFLEQNEKIL